MPECSCYACRHNWRTPMKGWEMPRRAAKVDVNHADVVETVRSAGASAQSLAALGRGVPDLLIGTNGLTLVGRFNPDEVRRLLERIEGVVIHNGANLLVEIKNPNVDKSHQRLTRDEVEWHRRWRGQVGTVLTADEALAAVGVTAQGELE